MSLRNALAEVIYLAGATHVAGPGADPMPPAWDELSARDKGYAYAMADAASAAVREYALSEASATRAETAVALKLGPMLVSDEDGVRHFDVPTLARAALEAALITTTEDAPDA